VVAGASPLARREKHLFLGLHRLDNMPVPPEYDVRMVEFLRLIRLDPEVHASERSRVMGLLHGLIPGGSIMEVGSTAIVGVVGKQDIDFVVRVPESAFADARRALDTHFERNPNQLSNTEYQGYYVDSPLDVAVQLIVAGGPYDHFERFLEALRSNPELVKAYNALKRKWEGKPMNEYRRAKRDFIESVLAKM